MKQHCQHIIAASLAFLLITGSLSSCRSTGTTDIPPTDSGNLFVDDPFSEGDASTNILGNLSHGAANPVLNEDGSRVPYEYNGGLFELDYHMTASGTAKNVGFLLFLDGIPQPYQVDGEGDVDYMHMFELEEDDQEYPFSFVFTPIIGTAGDTLDLKIYSVYYPQFQPDMVTSSSYGLYYNILEATVQITFYADADEAGVKAAAQTVAALSAVTMNIDDMTNDFANSRLSNGFSVEGQSAEDLLEDNVYSFIDYNGQTIYDNLDVSGQDTVHITYQMVGTPGAAFRVSLFANNRPITDGEAITWDITLSKGKVVTLEADIDVSALDDFTTFYVLACPVDRGSASDSAALIVIMNGPVLFYQGVS
jgi:hypothetical protein